MDHVDVDVDDFFCYFYTATYVQRGDDVTINEDKPPARDFLSDFQKMKLTHFFRHVLDMNHDDVISAEDFVALNQVRVKEFGHKITAAI